MRNNLWGLGGYKLKCKHAGRIFCLGNYCESVKNPFIASLPCGIQYISSSIINEACPTRTFYMQHIKYGIPYTVHTVVVHVNSTYYGTHV